MTRLDIGRLSLKILAIYAFIVALATLASPISVLQLSQGNLAFRQSNPIVLFIPNILLCVFSGFLWYAAKSMDSHAEPAASVNVSGITPEVLQNIAYSITGILILIDTIPHIIDFVTQGYSGWISGMAVPQEMRLLQFWLTLAQVLIRLALGIWLVLGSNRLHVLGTRLMEILKKSGE